MRDMVVCKPDRTKRKATCLSMRPVPMDKYQRKQLARWEKTKAKTDHKFQERMWENYSREEWKKVAITVERYTPHPATVFHAALDILKAFPRARTSNWDARYWPLFVHTGGPFFTFTSRGRLIAPPPPEFDKEVREGRERKDMESAWDLLQTLVRHMKRVDTIREELVARAQRNRVVQECLAIKEELMMNVWHPRRVEKILDLYGWDALDNLLGVE